MRYLIVTCLALLPGATLAANPDCEVMGGIVDKIVAERVEGTEMKAAMDRCRRLHRRSGTVCRYHPASDGLGLQRPAGRASDCRGRAGFCHPVRGTVTGRTRLFARQGQYKTP